MGTVGELDFPEVRRRIEVVFSRVVDDPEKRACGLDSEKPVNAA
jgi:hypothetical protein